MKKTESGSTGHRSYISHLQILKAKVPATFIFLLLSTAIFAQELPQTEDNFKKEVLALKTDVSTMQKNLYLSHQRFKMGIAAATLGYTVTIAGGLMLGRENDSLGKALLYTGGAIGLSGTILLVDAYKFVGRAAGGKYPERKQK